MSMDDYTHESFVAMAEAIIERAKREGTKFPGIVSYNQPGIMALGYILNRARVDGRTYQDQWSCSLQSFKDTPLEQREPLCNQLQALHARP
jgi:hypothetical protein